MPRVLIIGYGNRLCHDDGLGWRVIEELESSPDFSDAKLHACHQLTPELAESLSEADRVIFVDACRTAKPGDLFLEEVTVVSDTSCFSHELTPAALLTLGHELYGASPRAFVVGVGGESFGVGEGLSTVVSAAVPKLLAKVRDLCNEGPF